MAKLNCWEFKKCGRQPGGEKVHELGVCIVSVVAATNGLNSGKNGGRVCWAVAGTLCGGKAQGTFAAKLPSCLQCEFFKLVIKEEGADLVEVDEVIARVDQSMKP